MKSTDEATLLLNASFKNPMKIGGKDGGSFGKLGIESFKIKKCMILKLLKIVR